MRIWSAAAVLVFAATGQATAGDGLVVGLDAAVAEPAAVRHLEVPAHEPATRVLDVASKLPNLVTLVLCGDVWHEHGDLARLASGVRPLKLLVLDSTGYGLEKLARFTKRRPEVTVVRSQRTALAVLRSTVGVGAPQGSTDVPEPLRKMAAVVGERHFERAMTYEQWFDQDEYALAEGPIPPARMDDVGKLWTLETFEAVCFEPDDAVLAGLAPLRRLRTFGFPDAANGFTDEGFAVFGRLPALESVIGAPLTDGRMKRICEAESLRNLNGRCHSGSITGRGMGELAKTPHLRALGLSGLDFDGPELGVLAELRELETLFLRGRVGDYSALAGHPSLRSLTLVQSGSRIPVEEPGITDADARVIATCGRLEDVSVQLRPDRETAVAALASLPRLKRLQLTSPLRPSEWAMLGRVAGLEELNVHTRDAASPAGAEELRQLASLRNLKTLFAHGLRLDRTAMKALADLPRLEGLHLGGGVPDEDRGFFETWKAEMTAKHAVFTFN